MVHRAQLAQGDVWAAEGRLRERVGGGAGAVRGARLMASGLPHPQWNNGDVHEADFDLEAVVAWYGERAVAWGLRIPVGLGPRPGRYLFTERCMTLEPEQFVGAGRAELRRATSADLGDVVLVDSTAFGYPGEASAGWLAPMVEAGTVWLAEVGGRTVGVAWSVVTDEWAGPAVGVFGVGVLPEYRRRGIGSALTNHLVAEGFAAGAKFAHLNPDTEEAGRLYERLGFVEAPGLDVFADCR
ncbi:MAG: GNAT family N-acetyltransferase [Mycobacteriales bacterium]|jgi:GNAT superfamily N-acetyltransferase